MTQTQELIERRMLLSPIKPALRQVVEDLADTPGVALARIWLVQPGDVCSSCALRSQCRSQERCLHLVASAGQSRDPEHPESWDRLDGAFRRFPLNSQKIGRIGATGESLLVHHVTGHSSGLARQDWLAREGIQSFFGHPLTFEGNVVGVCAVFSRSELVDREVRLLRHIADYAARIVAQADALSDSSVQMCRLESENAYLKQDLESAALFGALVTCGPASRKLVEQIRMAAEHTKPLLITGERGSGKELAARLIHERGPNRTGPFVKIDAAALTSELFESNSASVSLSPLQPNASRRLSRLELAETGTLYIDSVEQTPKELQGRFAVALQSTGFGRELPESGQPCFGARIIASSAVDLHQEVSAERFRHDLYCAMSVLAIDVPPLRERREDIPFLVDEILSAICRRLHRPALEIEPAEMSRLLRYTWPGNVRELQQLLEYAALKAHGGRLVFGDVLGADLLDSGDESDAGNSPSFITADELKLKDRANVLACLKRSNWKVYGRGGAAELLGIKPTTLLYRMKVLGIRKPAR